MAVLRAPISSVVSRLSTDATLRAENNTNYYSNLCALMRDPFTFDSARTINRPATERPHVRVHLEGGVVLPTLD